MFVPIICPDCMKHSMFTGCTYIYIHVTYVCIYIYTYLLVCNSCTRVFIWVKIKRNMDLCVYTHLFFGIYLGVLFIHVFVMSKYVFSYEVIPTISSCDVFGSH